MSAVPPWALFLRQRLDEDDVSATMREVHKRDCDNIPQVDSEYTHPCDCGVPERLKREADVKRAILAHWLKNEGIEPDDWPGQVDPDATNAQLIDLDRILTVYQDHPDHEAARANLQTFFWEP